MIDAEKYKRSVTMLCPTCGSSQFEHDPDDTSDSAIYKCASCQLVLTKAQLIEANSENISKHVEGMKKEVIGDLENDPKRALSGSKFVKFR